uniref:Uncharacterized protein n=1 Tax=Arundo donax TaxID=35708 RepID=A0A0A9GW51_ARUDO
MAVMVLSRSRRVSTSKAAALSSRSQSLTESWSTKRRCSASVSNARMRSSVRRSLPASSSTFSRRPPVE